MGDFKDNLDEAEGRGFEDEEIEAEESEEGGEDFDNPFDGALMSPLIPLDDDGVGHPLVFIKSDGAWYIGGLMETSERGVLLSLPLMYMEGLIPSKTDPNKPTLQNGMRKELIAVRLPQTQWFSHSSILLLKTEDDSELGNMYQNSVKQSLAGDSSLIAPTNEEISIITSGK